MRNRLLAISVSFILAALSSGWTLLRLVLDSAGRADIVSGFGDADGTATKLAAHLLNSPWWVSALLTVALVGWWVSVSYRLMFPTVDAAPAPAAPAPAPQDAPALGGTGGPGGSGTIHGHHGVIVGGMGGAGGSPHGGRGGEGGSGVATGDHNLIMGGEGGSAGGWDGRGGKATPPLPTLAAMPPQAWGAGRGGAGANAQEYERRLALLIEIRRQYMEALPDTRPYILAGVDQIAPDWINARLTSLGETWRVEMGRDGYVLPSLDVAT